MTGFSPNETAPMASNPMGNPELGSGFSSCQIIPINRLHRHRAGTGTTAGGPNWVGYLTTAQNSSLVLSYNLAIGGATIDNSIVSSPADDLVSQVDVFQSTYRNKTKVAPWTKENAVFGVWIGINECALSSKYMDTDD